MFHDVDKLVAVYLHVCKLVDCYQRFVKNSVASVHFTVSTYYVDHVDVFLFLDFDSCHCKFVLIGCIMMLKNCLPYTQ